MKKKVTELIVCLLSVICFLTACHTPQSEKLADGTYQADVTLTGGIAKNGGAIVVDKDGTLNLYSGEISGPITMRRKQERTRRLRSRLKNCRVRSL